MVTLRKDIKHRLIDLRQDPKYMELRKDFRVFLKYIERLEYELKSLRVNKS